MKHYLNFKPTVVFRKARGFMFNTLLCAACASIVMFAAFFAYRYYCLSSLNKLYAAHQELLDKKLESHGCDIEKIKPDSDALEKHKSDYLLYKRFAYVCSNSLKALLDRFEGLILPDMRFINVSIRPERLIKVSIAGETAKLQSLTAFLNELYKCEVFYSPQIKRHALIKTRDESELIRFNIDLDYAGESGDLP